MVWMMKGEIQTVKDETQKGGFFQTQFSAASPCLFEPLPRLIFFYSILDSSWQEFIILTGFVSFSSSQKFKLKQKPLQALLTYSLRREFIIEPIARWINSRRRSPTSWSARFVFLLGLTRKNTWHNVLFDNQSLQVCSSELGHCSGCSGSCGAQSCEFRWWL